MLALPTSYRRPILLKVHPYQLAEDNNYAVAKRLGCWWSIDIVANYFISTPKPVTIAIKTHGAYRAGLSIAVDAIRYCRDARWLHGQDWDVIATIKPVIFVAVEPRPPSKKQALRAFESLLGSFFDEILPLIPPNWRSWAPVYRGRTVDEKLRILESFPFLWAPADLPRVPAYYLVIAGLDSVSSPETSAYVTRFLRVVEKLFVKSERGKILLTTDGPLSLAGLDRLDRALNVTGN